MDGTLLEKKYDLVGRIEALEQGGGIVYVPGDAISIQEFEAGERTVSVKYDNSLDLNEQGQLSVDFSRYKPLLYSFGNMTQIGTAVYSGTSHPVYTKVYDGITLSSNTVVTVDENFVYDKVIRINCLVKDNSSGDVYINPFQSYGLFNGAGAIPRIVNNTLSINCVGTVSGTATIVIDFTMPAQTSKKKASK